MRKSGRNVVLYHSADLDEFEIVRELLDRSEAELDMLEDQFGFALHRPIVVICFREMAEAAAIGNGSGFAISESNAVVVSRDGYMFETVRHELTHLFSAKWDALAPIFLTEGLAVWGQGSWWGQLVDEQACILTKDSHRSLADLLKPHLFRDAQHRDSVYVLAGSFTGFLIRNFGWDRYRKVFRSARRCGVRRAFREHLDRSFDELDREWRNELQAVYWPKLP